jgi:hypothetical protein
MGGNVQEPTSVVLVGIVSADYNLASPRFPVGGPIWPLTLKG